MVTQAQEDGNELLAPRYPGVLEWLGMAVLTYRDLPKLKEKHAGKKLVFCSGSFDLPHVGHLKFLEACKKLGDVLLVAVGNDRDIETAKGPGRPVMGEADRVRMIDALKPVDYTFINNSPEAGAPWLSPLEEIFDAVKPDVWVVNYEGSHMDDRREIAKRYGIELKILELKRTGTSGDEAASTTSLLERARGDAS